MSNELVQQLQAQLSALQASGNGGTTNPWGAPPPALQAQPAAPQSLIAGASIPIKLQTQHGEIRIYLHVSSSACANFEALNATIQQLQMMGIPLDFYQRQQNAQSPGGFGGNSYGGGNNSGYRRSNRGSW